MTQRQMNPAFAPSRVVAISSPEPTMEAERMKPGPRKRSLPVKLAGGSRTLFSLRWYGFAGISVGILPRSGNFLKLENGVLFTGRWQEAGIPGGLTMKSEDFAREG